MIIDEDKYKREVEKSLLYIKQTLEKIDKNTFCDDWKPYADKLFNKKVSEKTLLWTYKKIQEVRKIVLTMQESDMNIINSQTFRSIKKRLEVISGLIASNSLHKHSKDLSIDISSFFLIIKDIELLEDLIRRYPYSFNTLNNDGYNMLLTIVNSFVSSLNTHVNDSKFGNLDDVLYFDKVIKLLLNENFLYLTLLQKREIFGILKKAKNKKDYNSVIAKERYNYFLNRYIIIFSEAIKADMNKEKYSFIDSNKKEDLVYECMLDRDFNQAIVKEVNYLKSISSLEANHKNKLVEIYTVDKIGTRIMDDGFCIIKKDGLYELKVCITNPLTIFNKDSIIFDEAMKRTSSICYSDEDSQIMMLPSYVARERCSLLKDNIRSCISFNFLIDAMTGSVVDFKIKKEKVFVKDNLCFNDFGIKYFEKKEDIVGLKTWTYLQELVPILTNFYSMSDVYKNFFRKEANVSSTNITGDDTASKDIETLMIFTNMQFAMFCSRKGYPIMYRNHFIPEELAVILSSLEKSLKQEKNNDAWYSKLKQLANLYPRSNYGDVSLGHIGLGVPSYAHVTCPLERASDLYNISVFLECHFKNLKDNEILEIAKKSAELANYFNSKISSLDIFVKEYRRILKK